MVRTENEEADEPRAAAAADALERVTHSSPHGGTASQESCRRPPAERYVVSHTRLYTIHARGAPLAVRAPRRTAPRAAARRFPSASTPSVARAAQQQLLGNKICGPRSSKRARKNKPTPPSIFP